MNILDILTSKSHNVHYLKRYIRFIQACQNQQLEKHESHHICPKAKDMFPEYKSFREHPWNKCKMTPRQHFVAHWMLWKVFGNSQTRAFWRFNLQQNKTNTQCERVNSRVYEQLKADFSKNQSQLMKGKPKSKDHAAKLSANLISYNRSDEQRKRSKVRMTGHVVTEEQRQRIASKVSSHFNKTIWINDGTTSKRILSHEEIPSGWNRGRGRISL